MSARQKRSILGVSAWAATMLATIAVVAVYSPRAGAQASQAASAPSSAFAPAKVAPVPAKAPVLVPASAPVKAAVVPFVPRKVDVEQPGDVLKTIVAAFRGRSWVVLGAAVLVLLVWLCRKFGASRWPFLATDRGGAILALVWGLLSTVLLSLAAGKGLTLDLLTDGLVTGITAAGGWAVVKKLVHPGDSTPAKA